jgi:hypothetical protein
MAFEKKTWTDRQSEYPNRRVLTPTGTENEYQVSRSEGLIIQEGDRLNAENLNGLENRIDKAVNEVIATANNAMPKSGGTFTGDAVARATTDSSVAKLHNIVVYPANTDIASVPPQPAGTIICILK